MKRKILFILPLFLFTNVSFSAPGNNDILSVSVNIIARDESLKLRFPNVNLEEYFITISLFNKQDTNVSFRVMTCSWAESFITNNDSIFVIPQQCDSNFPETIELEPGQSVIFFGKLRSRIKYRYPSPPPAFKVAFVDLPLNKFPLSELSLSVTEKKKFRAFWSNDILLEEKLGDYKIEN